MTVYIGTSGWDYAEWRGHFYPADLPRSRFLAHYATRLGACELNATFYGRQTDRSVARWRESTPEGFVFSAKAHMRITHTKQMAPDKDTVEFARTFLSSLSGLGEKLAVVLFQIPAFRERDDEGLAALLRALPAGPRYAFEFKSDTWQSPDVVRTLADAGAALCLAPESGGPPPTAVSGSFGYVRLRGTSYSDGERQDWLRLLSEEGKSHDLYVFARHKGIDPAASSAGVGFASWLAEKLSND